MAAKEEKEQRILEAAMKVFAKHGFHKAKIEDIAKEAGIGKGTLYGYFKSKKELFQEMIKYSMKRYTERVKDIISEHQDIEKGLMVLTEFHGKFLNEHLDMVHTSIGQSNVMSKDMKCWMIESRLVIMEMLVGYIEKGITEGVFRQDLDAKLATLGFIGTINQYYTMEIFIEQKKHHQIDPKSPVEMLLKGLR